MGLEHPASIFLIAAPPLSCLFVFGVYLYATLRPAALTWTVPPLLPAIYLRIGIGFLLTSLINCCATIWPAELQFITIILCLISGYLLIEMLSGFVWWASLEGGGHSAISDRLFEYQSQSSLPGKLQLRWLMPALCHCGQRFRNGKATLRWLRIMVAQVALVATIMQVAKASFNFKRKVETDFNGPIPLRALSSMINVSSALTAVRAFMYVIAALCHDDGPLQSMHPVGKFLVVRLHLMFIIFNAVILGNLTAFDWLKGPAWLCDDIESDVRFYGKVGFCGARCLGVIYGWETLLLLVLFVICFRVDDFSRMCSSATRRRAYSSIVGGNAAWSIKGLCFTLICYHEELGELSDIERQVQMTETLDSSEQAPIGEPGDIFACAQKDNANSNGKERSSYLCAAESAVLRTEGTTGKKCTAPTESSPERSSYIPSAERLAPSKTEVSAATEGGESGSRNKTVQPPSDKVSTMMSEVALI